MPLSDEQLRDTVRQLVRRPGHETVRSDIRGLLLHLGVPVAEIKFEVNLAEIRGRADALLANTVLEFKSDLRREQDEAERQLAGYLADRERATGHRFVGVATDGLDFRAYELRHGKLAALRNSFNLRSSLKDHHDNAAEAGHALAAWLSPFLNLRPDLIPDPSTVRLELGRQSVAYEIARSRIEDLWEEIKGEPSVILKRELWAERLSLVYGSAIGDDALFFQHTYLTIVAKTMATLVLGVEPRDAASLLAGQPFQDAGIYGVVESDFFDWIVLANGGADVVNRISAQVARFRLGDIKHDVLKVLYESLIDPEQRHDLGEYYTPDWLAQWVCERAIERPLEQRVLDPSCGSGTFLFHAVRRFLAAADTAGMAPADALVRCTQLVFGTDVHPVAVINARVTYLLALTTDHIDECPRISIPVYLGDSLQWNTEQVLDGQTVHIKVPPAGPEEQSDPRKAPDLTFPIRVAANPSLFDEVINEMITLSERRAQASIFGAWLANKSEAVIPASLHDTLTVTYANLRKLRDQRRNHIWGYVARNLSRPVWLSTNGEKVHVLIGNPPWLPQHDMSGPMQARFRDGCREFGIWAGGKVATHQDLSAYFFARCVDRYLRKDGVVAFVMPYATMSRQQYENFRKGVFAGGERGSVRFTEAWTFDDSVQPLFKVPSCVLFAREGEAGALPASVTAYSGQLLKQDASAEEAGKALTSVQASWPLARTTLVSAYGSQFRQGATIVPRFLFLVQRAYAGRFGQNSEFPLVESRRTNLEKKPWRDLAPLRGPIPQQFLRPLYLGESIAPFRLLDPAEAIIPWEARQNRLLDSESALQSAFPALADWLGKAEAFWSQYGKGKIGLNDRLDKFHGLSAQQLASKLRVVYSKSGTISAAMILRDQSAVIDHKLYWTVVSSLREGRFMVAILNSEVTRAKVAPQQSRGQWGARDFDKLLAEAIPQFDPKNHLHLELADAAATAEKVAARVALPENVHFIRARKLIRDALKADGIAQQIDALTARLLNNA